MSKSTFLTGNKFKDVVILVGGCLFGFIIANTLSLSEKIGEKHFGKRKSKRSRSRNK